MAIAPRTTGCGREVPCQLKGFSRQGLIDQLSFEFGDKFTVEEATFGATQAGVC